MTTDLADAYARISDLYRRQLDLLTVDEPDLDAVAGLIAGVDAELARLPPSDRLPALERDEAERLAAAAREADTLRGHAATHLDRLRDRQVRSAAGDERAVGALRAYGAPGIPDTARFLDQRR